MTDIYKIIRENYGDEPSSKSAYANPNFVGFEKFGVNK